MREIKFRAYSKTANKIMMNVQDMYDSLGIWYDNHGNEIDPYKGFETTSFYQILEDKNCIVMQFTGLKDRNGKDIYEGDILQFKNIHMRLPDLMGWVKYDEMRAGWTVTDTFEENSYGAMLFQECDNGVCDAENLEVIGNIYQNPELIEITKPKE